MKLKRRPFLKQSAKAMGVAGLASLGAASYANPASGLFTEEGIFVHHVFFWLKDPGNEEEKKRFEAGMKDLMGIKAIKKHYIGKAADTNREVIDNTYDYSLLVVFKDESGHDIYQEHATHLKFIEDFQDLWEKVLVYDSVNI